MKISFKYFLLFLFYADILLPQAELSGQFNYAVGLFNEEKYFEAVTEFKRLLFFDPDSIYAFQGNMLIGYSYKNGGKYPEALQYFTQAQNFGSTQEEIFKAKIETIRVNILARRTSWALKLIDELEMKKNYAGKQDEINYWKGWAYMFNDDWEKASESFRSISPDHELKKLADNVEEKKYSVTIAKISSFIIPGAGQFYTGNYLSGLISLGWNALWGFITINSFIAERYFDGIMTGNFLWLRFYSGNIQNAQKFAVEKNMEITNYALEYLQNKYQGDRP